MDIKFNVNDKVRVKLTKTGVSMLRFNHTKRYLSSREADKHWEEPKVDAEGYTEFHMWELMNEFGDLMYNGQGNMPFETEMVLSATHEPLNKALQWFGELVQHCPQIQLSYNTDADEGPIGFHLHVQGCTKLDLRAPTLDRLIALGMNTKPDEDGDIIATDDKP